MGVIWPILVGIPLIGAGLWLKSQQTAQAEAPAKTATAQLDLAQILAANPNLAAQLSALQEGGAGFNLGDIGPWIGLGLAGAAIVVMVMS